jgi:hypothetical protein
VTIPFPFPLDISYDMTGFGKIRLTARVRFHEFTNRQLEGGLVMDRWEWHEWLSCLAHAENIRNRRNRENE